MMVGLFSAKLILTPLLLCIYLNKYDLGRARSQKTLPEAQRTQGIESITQIIMYEFKNQAWGLKLK